MVGSCATLGIAFLAWSGLLHVAELRAIDWRYQHARSSPEPMSDQIALVAIDNNSLDTVGRWPWPRRLLGHALEELAHAGARTVAIDLLLDEPDTRDGGGDEALAAAMTGFHTVLGADVGRTVFSLGIEWEDAQGEALLAQISAVLAAQIDADPSEIADQFKLTGRRRESLLEHPLRFKARVAWKVIEEMARKGPIPPLDQVLLVLTGGRATLQSFDARLLIEELYRRATSWEHLREEVAYEGARESVVGAHQLEPPIPAFARAASGVGVVTSDGYDLDGAKRRSGTVWSVPGGRAHQFGLAAAAKHLGIAQNEIDVQDDLLHVGAVTLELENGDVFLDWPTSTFDGFSKSGDENAEGRPAISIGRLVRMHVERERLRSLERERDEARRAVEQALPLLANVGASGGGEASHELFAQELNDIRMDGHVTEGASALVQKYLALFEGASDGQIVLDRATEQLRSAVRDKLVFIGWVATGALADQVQTPLGPETPGVFVHAVAADMVLNDHARRNAPHWVGLVAILALGAIASICSARFSTLWSAGVALALVALWAGVAGAYVFNELRLVLPVVGPMLSPIASWATGTAAVAILTSRDRARITRQFSARVSPELVAQLAGNPGALTVGGQEREITVMFGDLAGFTTIAEALGGPGVVRTLNLYLGRLADELVSRKAYVNKFLGDGFMAFWSAFGVEPQQELLAVESALACQRAMAKLAEGSPADAPKITVRLGIATGIAVVGDCGAPPKLNDYTAIGDVVNLASRLESANKQFGTGILIDGATRAGIAAKGQGLAVKFRALGSVVVVGQSKPVDVFEVVGAEADQAWIDATEQAVALFRAGRMSEANESWIAFEAKFGASKLSSAYREAIARGDGASDGVLRLVSK